LRSRGLRLRILRNKADDHSPLSRYVIDFLGKPSKGPYLRSLDLENYARELGVLAENETLEYHPDRRSRRSDSEESDKSEGYLQ
jgi:hypothetical protein